MKDWCWWLFLTRDLFDTVQRRSIVNIYDDITVKFYDNHLWLLTLKDWYWWLFLTWDLFDTLWGEKKSDTGGCYGVTSITAFSYTHIYEYIHLYTYTQKHHQSFDHRRRKSASKSLSKCIFWRTCLNFDLCPSCIFQLVPSCPLHLHWNVIKCPTFQQLFFAE